MSTQLRELFDTVAESQPPDGLAARAVAGAHRRRQRFTVAGSALAAAAVVVGVVMVNPSQRTDSAPRPNEVVSLPEVLPVPDGLPELSEAPMDSASAAYIVGSQVVVIDAATAEGARLDLRMPTISGGSGRKPLLGPDASLALSPSGQSLMVSADFSTLGTGYEWIVVVDIPTGYALLQPSLQLASVTGKASVIPSRMAWSPDGQTFACICSFEGQSPQLVTADMATVGDDGNDLTVGTVEETDVTPRQISWGTAGLVAQLDGMKAPWRLVPLGESATLADPKEWPPLESVSLLGPGAVQFSAVAMGHSNEGGFLAKLALGKGGSGPLWVVPEAGEYRTVESVPSRPWLGALGDSYFVVLTDWKGDPYNDEVDRVDAEGETTFTTLPPGATAISFASGLVD